MKEKRRNNENLNTSHLPFIPTIKQILNTIAICILPFQYFRVLSDTIKGSQNSIQHIIFEAYAHSNAVETNKQPKIGT